MFKLGRPPFLVLITTVVYALLLIGLGVGGLHECAHPKHDTNLKIALTIYLISLSAGLIYLFAILSGRWRNILIIIPILHSAVGLSIMPFLMIEPSRKMEIFAFLNVIFFFDVGVFMLYIGSRELSRRNRSIAERTAEKVLIRREVVLSKKVILTTLVLIHVLFFIFSTRIPKYSDSPYIVVVIERAQKDYLKDSPSQSYAKTFEDLGTGQGAGNVGFIDPRIASGEFNGYYIEMVSGAPNSNDQITTWSATAYPIRYNVTGRRSFYVDQTGIFRAVEINGHKGTVQLPILDVWKMEYVFWWSQLH